MVGDASIITYICKAEYQGISAQTQITFTRSDTGLNGEDGTSISIKGSATSVTPVEGTDYYTIVYGDGSLSTSELGDAYLYNGDLYVCTDSRDGEDYFINVGSIQGPEGESAKNIILNADSQVFRVDKNDTISPSTITVTGQEVNTNITEWTYSINGGQTFLSNAPSGVIRDGNRVSITGADIASDMIVIKASDGTYSDTYTIYKVFDGATGDIGQSAPIAFLTNEHITFSADAQGQITGTTVTTNVAAYSGATKVTPTIGDITGLPEGISINTEDITVVNKELILVITVSNNTTLGSASSTSGTVSIPIISPINTVLTLSWSKVNTGATGADGTDAVTFQVYSADGYVLSKDTPAIMLQTFAYNGDVPIEAEATYQWYKKLKTPQYELASLNHYDIYGDYYIRDDEGLYQKIEIADEEIYNTYFGEGTNASTPLYIETEWERLTEEKTEEVIDETTNESTFINTTVLATSPYVTIYHTNVSFSTSYMCKMTFNGSEYVDVVTIDDKNDINTVFTSKPTSYSEGDIWIVGNDYTPEGIGVGTVLKAQHTNDTYTDEDWVVGTKYDDKLSNLETTVGTYQQYISLDTNTGITMNAIDENGNVSEFSTTLSNTQLSFNQAGEAVAYINNHKMHITEAEIESPLTVTGKYSGSTVLLAPTINLGDFSLVIESNGSLSITSNL